MTDDIVISCNNRACCHRECPNLGFIEFDGATEYNCWLKDDTGDTRIMFHRLCYGNVCDVIEIYRCEHCLKKCEG